MLSAAELKKKTKHGVYSSKCGWLHVCGKQTDKDKQGLHSAGLNMQTDHLSDARHESVSVVKQIMVSESFYFT